MADFKSFFRKSGLGISKSLITTLIVLAIMAYAVSQITSPDFIKPLIQATIVQQLGSQELDTAYAGILIDCRDKKNISVPLEQFSKTLVLDCDKIRAGGKENFTDIFAGAATEALFGEAYGSNICTGFDCVALFQNTEDPVQKISALMNENFNTFVSNLSKYFMIGALICAILILLLAEGIHNKLTSLGYPLTIAGLPYLGMNFAKDRLVTILPSRALMVIDGLIDTLSGAFLVMLVSGVILLIIGWALKFKLDKKAKEIGSKIKDKKKK